MSLAVAHRTNIKNRSIPRKQANKGTHRNTKTPSHEWNNQRDKQKQNGIKLTEHRYTPSNCWINGYLRWPTQIPRRVNIARSSKIQTQSEPLPSSNLLGSHHELRPEWSNWSPGEPKFPRPSKELNPSAFNWNNNHRRRSSPPQRAPAKPDATETDQTYHNRVQGQTMALNRALLRGRVTS
jgi:hypothetical protein